MTIKTKLSLIFGVLMIIVVVSVLYTNNLARQLAQEEQERVKIWAQATEKLILASPEEDIDFYSTIIERNTTIPVYMLDSAGNVLYIRNVCVDSHIHCVSCLCTDVSAAE